MGKSDASNTDRHSQQSIIIVPSDAPGVKIVRPMQVFGYDDAPEGHCEIIYDNVKVPLSNLVLGWGKGFEVAIPRHVERGKIFNWHDLARSFKDAWGAFFGIA